MLQGYATLSEGLQRLCSSCFAAAVAFAAAVDALYTLNQAFFDQVLREDRSGAAPPADVALAGAALGFAEASAALQPGAAVLTALPEGEPVDGRAADGEPPAVALEECVLQNSRQARWLLTALGLAHILSWLPYELGHCFTTLLVFTGSPRTAVLRVAWRAGGGAEGKFRNTCGLEFIPTYTLSPKHS